MIPLEGTGGGDGAGRRLHHRRGAGRAGRGRLAAVGKVEVAANGSSETVEARHVIVATGSKPAIPPIPGANNAELVITSDDALALTELPHSIVVIGGGAVGAEWAD